MSEPRRVLLVTGAMGEGHHAAAQAVQERVHLLWPEAEVRWAETLSGRGWWVAPLFRGIYAGCVRSMPWLYELYFWLLWHWRFFVRATRAVHGRWSGPALAAVVAEFRPDLVVSTFPEGTAALGWLRTRGRLDVPTAVLVCDAAPHPLWAHPELDVHLVLVEEALPVLRRAEPSARGVVCGLPVVSVFQPPGPAADDQAPPGRRRVLISCGSLGFGAVERTARAALAADIDVVVACGHNDGLRERLSRLGAPPGRLRAMGWLDRAEMAELTAAVDVVVTNAGGAGALEALACGRPVLVFQPIAGHGRANASLLAGAGLARGCATDAELTAALRGPLPAAEQRRIRSWREAHDFTAAVAALAELAGSGPSTPLRPQDAFFRYARTPAVDQRLGAVIVMQDPEGLTDWSKHLVVLIEERQPELPMLRRRLVQPGRWRRPRWALQDRVEPAAHLRPWVPDVAAAGGWSQVLAAFFGEPLPTDRPPWALQLVRDHAAGQTAVLAALEHALGDGLAVTDTLVRLLVDRPACPGLGVAAGREAAEAGTIRGRPRLGRSVARGLVSLATAGFAPASALNGPMDVRRRRFATLALPAARVRAAARQHGVGTTALVLGVLAEALHGLLDARQGSGGSGGATDRLRAMVPMTTRTSAGTDSRASGNRTVAESVNLPVGPMPPAERVRQVAHDLETLARRGQPEAARAVLSALGALPAPVHAALVRLVYHRRFFNVLVSVMPGSRRPQHVRGCLIGEVYPVLPLADGVGLAVGVLAWGTMMGVGVTVDPTLVPETDELLRRFALAFDAVRGDG